MNAFRKLAGATILTGLVITFLVQRYIVLNLREENRTLKAKADHLHHSKQQSALMASPSLSSNLHSADPELLKLRGEYGGLRRQNADLTNLSDENRRLRAKWYEELLSGSRLRLEHVEPYLASKQRNAESLITASRITGDLQLLREAMEKFPNDAQVNYAAYFSLKEKLSASERQQLMESLKNSSSDNALAYYLSALQNFRSGQTASAIQELASAPNKAKWEDYSAANFQSAEEAYRSAGFSEIESKTLAASSMLYPHLAELKALGKNISDLYLQYKQAGDNDSAVSAIQVGIHLCERLRNPSTQSTVISDLVSISIERELLGKMDAGSPYSSSGQTVKERLDALSKQRDALKEIAAAGTYESLKQMPEEDQIAFYNRMKTSGELVAIEWLKSKKPINSR